MYNIFVKSKKQSIDNLGFKTTLTKRIKILNAQSLRQAKHEAFLWANSQGYLKSFKSWDDAAKMNDNNMRVILEHSKNLMKQMSIEKNE